MPNKLKVQLLPLALENVAVLCSSVLGQHRNFQGGDIDLKREVSRPCTLKVKGMGLSLSFKF